MTLDVPRATALASAYLQSGADRKAHQSAVAFAACRFQDDPHNLDRRGIRPQFDRFARSLAARDRATARRLRQKCGASDCYARFEKDWIYN